MAKADLHWDDLRLNLDPGLSDPFVPELPAPAAPKTATPPDAADRLQAGDAKPQRLPCWPQRCRAASRAVPSRRAPRTCSAWRRREPCDDSGLSSRVPVPAPAARHAAAHHQRRVPPPRRAGASDAPGPAHAAHPGPPAAVPLPGPGGDRKAARRPERGRPAVLGRPEPGAVQHHASCNWTGPSPPSRAWCSARCARSSSTAAARCNGTPAPASSAPSPRARTSA